MSPSRCDSHLGSSVSLDLLLFPTFIFPLFFFPLFLLFHSSVLIPCLLGANRPAGPTQAVQTRDMQELQERRALPLYPQSSFLSLSSSFLTVFYHLPLVFILPIKATMSHHVCSAWPCTLDGRMMSNADKPSLNVTVPIRGKIPKH